MSFLFDVFNVSGASETESSFFICEMCCLLLCTTVLIVECIDLIDLLALWHFVVTVNCCYVFSYHCYCYESLVAYVSCYCLLACRCNEWRWPQPHRQVCNFNDILLTTIEKLAVYHVNIGGKLVNKKQFIRFTLLNFKLFVVKFSANMSKFGSVEIHIHE